MPSIKVRKTIKFHARYAAFLALVTRHKLEVEQHITGAPFVICSAETGRKMQKEAEKLGFDARYEPMVHSRPNDGGSFEPWF